MPFKISYAKKPTAKTDIAIITVFDDLKLSDHAKALDEKTGGYIAHALKTHSNFEGKHGQTLRLTLPAKSPHAYVLMLGLGKPSALTTYECEIAGAKAQAAVKGLKASAASWYCDGLKGKIKTPVEDIPAYVMNGFQLASYNFETYKSITNDKKEKPLETFEIVGAMPNNTEKTYKQLKAVTSGVFLARDLVNEPPNMLYPDSYAKQIRKELKAVGVDVEILDEKRMEKLGMGAALAVGQGSERPPRMVVMRWDGSKSKKTTQPLTFVGKGVTFDTGGISIKPSAGMDEMKMDMGGSAAVVGLMKSLALRKSKANVVSIVGLVENMPSHNAYRPGDIIKAMSGKTIEILNTDAEGRLVLADAMTYVQKKYKPRAMIDLATLTGAMMVALGHEHCGTFVSDDTLWKQMEKASEKTGEKLWRMPLDAFWKKDTESAVADIQNLGKSGRYGGACSAAGFLWHFVEDDLPWAHMDIAGTAWRKSARGLSPKHATGFGVRVLDKMVQDYYE